jgi:hypothetical protein
MSRKAVLIRQARYYAEIEGLHFYSVVPIDYPDSSVQWVVGSEANMKFPDLIVLEPLNHTGVFKGVRYYKLVESE